MRRMLPRSVTAAALPFWTTQHWPRSVPEGNSGSCASFPKEVAATALRPPKSSRDRKQQRPQLNPRGERQRPRRQWRRQQPRITANTAKFASNCRASYPYPPLLSPSRSSWPLAAKPCPLLRLLASRFLCWPPDKPCQPSWPLDAHLGPSPDQLAPHHPLGPLQAHLGPSLPLLVPCRPLLSALAPSPNPLGPSPPL